MRRLVLLLFSLLPLHAAEPARGVEFALTPAVKTIAPGATFTVGLQIHHHPGFHTYWKNPGVAGVPTSLEWDLPAGFTAGPIRWPVPELSDMAGHPVFGYERDVTLLVDLTAPASIDVDQVTLSAKATWMACAAGCRPGEEPLSITLPVAAEINPDPELRSMFLRAEAEIPTPLESWSAELISDRDAETIVLDIRPPKDRHPLENLRIFSEDGQISSDPAPEIQRLRSHAWRITVPRAEFGPTGKKTLPLAISVDTPDGRVIGTLDPAYPSAAGEQVIQQ